MVWSWIAVRLQSPMTCCTWLDLEGRRSTKRSSAELAIESRRVGGKLAAQLHLFGGLLELLGTAPKKRKGPGVAIASN